MINYGYVLKYKELDNPSAICRATYLFSNVGEMLKCYGRTLRFPKDKNLYLAKMKLAMGDIMMQCRLIEEEQKYNHHIISPSKVFTINYILVRIAQLAGIVTEHLVKGKCILEYNDEKYSTQRTTTKLLDSLGDICYELDWDVDEIEHLGFIHTCERFEQFEKNGWK